MEILIKNETVLQQNFITLKQICNIIEISKFKQIEVLKLLDGELSINMKVEECGAQESDPATDCWWKSLLTNQIKIFCEFDYRLRS